MIVAALQARMGSTRLPGKVLADIGGQPMLARQLARIRRSRRIERLCVATSDERADDAIADLAAQCGVVCHRGPASDVLERVWQAGHRFEATHLVRLTGDCPLSDPVVIDAVIDAHLAAHNDLTSNAIDRSYPDGLDVEVVSFAALTAARAAAVSPADREHVTQYLYRSENGFRVGVVHCEPGLGQERWTVDYADDLEFVRRVFAAFPGREAEFSWREIVDLLTAQPALRELNARHGAEYRRTGNRSCDNASSGNGSSGNRSSGNRSSGNGSSGARGTSSRT